nr:diguanylate cyclase [Planosporangium thailandense]
MAELGRGARSVVYRVHHNGTDLAMKVLHAPLDADRRTLASFRREASLLALADHPGLPAVHDVGEADGRPYLIMDLIEGQELATALRSGPLAEERILQLGIEVAEALAAVHRVGLVHRDVKPQNILLSAGGRARLIDLGMATRTSAELSEVVAGTLVYAAPEQAGTLKRPVDARADLYSLGVVLYECAAGRVPFASADVGELLRLHATVPPPDLRALRGDLSATLVQIIGRLLAKDPDDRYATCASLVADLRALTADRTADLPLGRLDVETTGRVEADFVGRETELAELHGRWERVLSGSGALALIRGASGAGRTRLTGEFAARLDRSGLPVLTAACGHAASPLAPLSGAVERYLATVARRDADARTETLGWVRSAAGAAAPYLRRLSPALAEVLSDGDETVDDQQDGYIRAVAGFLADLARTAGGGVLVFDDAESADSATVRVLHLLASQLADAPLLLVVTTGGGEADQPDLLPAGAVDADLTLGTLDRDALHRLVSSLLGRLRLEPSLVERIVARSGGTPLGVIEYVGAVLDAGLILPRWGTWVLDEAGLNDLDLPTDMLGLLLRRVDELGSRTRDLLTAAAVVGVRFTRALACSAARLSEGDGALLLDQAVAHGVLDRHDGGYTFVHDRIRRALLDGLPSDRLRDLHQRVADAIDASGATDPAQRYALARHLTQGHPDRDRARTSAACWAAGQLALAEHGAAEAVEFLEAAIAHADGQAGAELSAMHEALGVAHHRAGHLAQALETLSVALDSAPNGIDRARILEQQAKQHLAYWNTHTAVDEITRAMAELGRPLPRNPVWRALTAAAMYVAAIVIERTGIGFGTKDPEKRAWYRQRANLYETGFDAAVRGLRFGLAVVFNARRRYAAARLGPSHEYLRALGTVAGMIWLFLGYRDSRGMARAKALAQRQGDPAAAAYIESLRQTVITQVGVDPDTEGLLRWLEKHAAFTEFVYAIDIAQASSFRLLIRGRAVEAVAATQRAHARLGAADLAAHPVGHVGAALAAALGRPVDAAASLHLLDAEVGAFRDPAGRIYLLNACAILAVEQREYGDIFDRVAAELAALKIRHPLMVINSLRGLFSTIAYGRLEQARAATGADRAPALAAARRALRDLRQVAWGSGPGPQLKAHYLVGRAHLRLLAGDPRGALDRLAAADRQLAGQDVPLAAYEGARIRARALAELGRTIESTAAAATALSIAQQLSLPHRAEWVRAEFGVDIGTTTGTGSSTRSIVLSSVTSTVSGTSGAESRRLAALEKLSVTASRILDPDELTRVALDETIRILSAERAYLFLTDGDGRLRPHRGRDAAGSDLDELADYGSTVVERVRQSREPVIVTGTDEGAALGSKSAVAHGLRSIIAAPLLFDGRLLGVVYLDSRVAKGMFTPSDAGILTAMTNHIAAALETARAAQLAVAVRAAEQQRDVADKLRDAMLELSSSLNPDDVLHRLLLMFKRLLPNDASCLIRVRDDALVVTTDADPGTEPRLVSSSPSNLDPVLTADSPAAGNGATAPAVSLGFGEASPDTSWLAVPLHTRAGYVGSVVLTADRPGVYGPTEVQLAAALAGQAMVAYDNARLFSQVEQMATTDALTGVANRRHFFTVAEQDTAQARAAGTTLMAVMLDIDHFKQINDQRGHQVGDQVIAAVAGRLRQTLRDTDRLGRYGGEEFAILVTEPVRPLAERLRLAVSDSPVGTDHGSVPVTISVGVCVFDAGQLTLTEALRRADAALYRAKDGGRNRVVIDEA